MSRLALYRKYRSADFKDVIGQDHITSTLAAAIKGGSFSHAYLFTGPRGVGKTSVARIMARNVNSLAATEDISSYLDIIEIDAASNRGIDEIRSLREKVAVAPAVLDYKVYIIDEVHMLTREAFNALLKTLEEPPAHVIFILATTDAHKLPDTIISRTQRYDFRPIGNSDMASHLAGIAKKEKIEIEEDALRVIATASRGGFRDGISILDQLAVVGKPISKKYVYSILGLSNEEATSGLVRATLASQPTEALNLLEKTIAGGNDPQQLTYQMLDYLRAGLFARSGLETRPELEYFTDVRPEKIVYMIENLTKALTDFKVSSHYSLPLELAVYKSSLALTEIASSPSVVKEENNQPAQVAASASEKNKPKMHVNIDENSLCMKGLSLIKERNNSLYAVMLSANPRVEADTLVLDCRFRFHKERIEESKNRSLIEGAMKKTFGRTINLRCDIVSEPKSTPPDDKDSELISSALEILGGEIVNG